MADVVSLKILRDRSIEGDDPFLAAACHPYTNPQDLQSLESVLFATTKMKLHFAGASYTPASVLHSLAADGNRRIRLRVAKHPATTGVTLEELARSEIEEDISTRIAGHANASQDMLEKLYEIHLNSPVVRRALCNNPRTPHCVLRGLAVQASLAELKGLVRNAEADEVILQQCWDKKDVFLQAEVATHPNCPPDLRNLAERTPQPLVRRKLAQNPALANEVLTHLLIDDEAQVRAAAVRALSAPMMAALAPNRFEPSRQVRRDQARRTGLPVPWINRLACDTDSWVRRLIARNQNTPEETMCHLADDPVTEVRRGVARNPMCTIKLLLQLAHDPHPWVRAGVALRADISERLIFELSRGGDIDVLSALGQNPSTPKKILGSIARHENRDVRRAVILNEGAPRSVLNRLLEDSYPINRLLLARHQNLSNDDLERLMFDPEPTVRFAGAKALAARLH